jgi:integrase/recombinase XerD
MMSRLGKTGSAVVLTDQQLKIVMRTVLGSGNTHSYRNYLIVILSHLCGLRAKELASLKVSDVWVGGKVVETLRLIGAYTKGGKHRDIPLINRKVVDAIQKHITYQMEMRGHFVEPSSALFRSQKGRFFSPNTMAQLIKRIYADAGCGDASSHSGRRKFATTLIESGADINCVKLLMGHSSIQTTARYFSTNPNRLANLMGSLSM